jgi:hypothetical protein
VRQKAPWRELCRIIQHLGSGIFDSDRAAVLNIRARLVIGFVKQHIVELPPINKEEISGGTFLFCS